LLCFRIHFLPDNRCYTKVFSLVAIQSHKNMTDQTTNQSNSPADSFSDAKLEPTMEDIVFGRGKKYQDHEGNKYMRECVKEYKQLYFALQRFEKQTLAETIYEKLVEGGARFLRRDEKTNSWVLVERNLATQKIAHALRCKKHLFKASTKKRKDKKKTDSPARRVSSSTIEISASARGDFLASVDYRELKSQVVGPASEPGRVTSMMDLTHVVKPMMPRPTLSAGPRAPLGVAMSSVAALQALDDALQMQELLNRQRIMAIVDLQWQAAQQQAASAAYYNAALGQIMAMRQERLLLRF